MKLCPATSKSCYTQGEAERAARKLKIKAYRCPTCHDWHTTRQQQDQSKSRRFREKGLIG